MVLAQKESVGQTMAKHIHSVQGCRRQLNLNCYFFLVLCSEPFKSHLMRIQRKLIKITLVFQTLLLFN